jgi:hypothetical protein
MYLPAVSSSRRERQIEESIATIWTRKGTKEPAISAYCVAHRAEISSADGNCFVIRVNVSIVCLHNGVGEHDQSVALLRT